MEVQVVFTTQLKALLGHAVEAIQLPAGATVRHAVDELAERHREAFEALVLDDRQNRLPSVLVCVNDQQATDTTPLSDGDTVTLLSAISGG